MRAFSAALVCVAVLVLSLVVWCDAPRHESDLAIAHGGLHEVELRTNRSRAEVIPMRVGSNARQHEVEAGRSADVRVGRLVVNAADSIDFDRAQVFFWPKASGSKLSAGEIIKSDVDSRGEFPIPQQVAESYQRYVAAAIGSGLVTSEPVAVSKIDPLELPAMRLLAKRLVFHDRNGGELRLSKNLKRQGSYAYPSRAVFLPPWEEVHIPRIVLEGAGISRPGLMGERATWLLLGARPLGDESAESGCQFYANFPGYHPDSVGVSLEPMSNVVGEQRGLTPEIRTFPKVRLGISRKTKTCQDDVIPKLRSSPFSARRRAS